MKVTKFKFASWQVIDWLEENVGPMHTDDEGDTIELDSPIITGEGWHLFQTYTTINVTFDKESDELMFALKWG